MKKGYVVPFTAFILSILVVALPSFLTPENVVTPGSAEGAAALNFIQLVALVIPALAIFAQAMHTYSYRLSDIKGKSGGVGPFGPETFRAGVWLVVGGSGFLVTMGLVSFMRVLQLPPSLETGMLMILFGIVLTTVWVLLVGLLAINELD